MLSARPQHTQVDTRPLLILSIRLACLEEDSSPAWLLSKYLLPWFGSGPGSTLRYIDMPYNLVWDEDGEAYRNAWDRALTALGEYVSSSLSRF